LNSPCNGEPPRVFFPFRPMILSMHLLVTDLLYGALVPNPLKIPSQGTQKLVGVSFTMDYGFVALYHSWNSAFLSRSFFTTWSLVRNFLN